MTKKELEQIKREVEDALHGATIEIKISPMVVLFFWLIFVAVLLIIN